MSTIDRISTHILDIAIGKPAAGIPAVIEYLPPTGGPIEVGKGVTDTDGRINPLNISPVDAGVFRITFITAEYFQEVHGTVFYPSIIVQVNLDGSRNHYHLPVLAGTFSFSSYLGS